MWSFMGRALRWVILLRRARLALFMEMPGGGARRWVLVRSKPISVIWRARPESLA
uniref:Uncharacterized protein n=1 Tax=Mycobacterium riyadhense TaxID=486698 RepID=A0A653ED55_9MYCO|nr:hypothetical protein BIN_B_00001 [Mycobacterium riyadhense]